MVKCFSQLNFEYQGKLLLINVPDILTYHISCNSFFNEVLHMIYIPLKSHGNIARLLQTGSHNVIQFQMQYSYKICFQHMIIIFNVVIFLKSFEYMQYKYLKIKITKNSLHFIKMSSR